MPQLAAKSRSGSAESQRGRSAAPGSRNLEDFGMKLVKSLLLGSAAGLTAVAGAQAADLPARKAVAPAVEYVRVCTAYGAGFFYIPGTDTCLRITGFAQAAYQYTFTRGPRPDLTGYRTMGRIALDARTDTAYGTLRTFIRMDMRKIGRAHV